MNMLLFFVSAHWDIVDCTVFVVKRFELHTGIPPLKVMMMKMMMMIMIVVVVAVVVVVD